MNISYDDFTSVFLDKVTEYTIAGMADDFRTEIVDGYMKRAIAQFNKVCKYDLKSRNDDERKFNADIEKEDIDEIVDIVTEGMLVQWMKPYVYKQENLENSLNTADYSGYSPAELLHRIEEAYSVVKKDFTNRIRSYSYEKGDLTDLHI